jgi:hypothetical protein
MKNKKYACYCCNIHRDSILRLNDVPCEDCVRLGQTQPCYHQAISDEGLMIRLRAECDDLLQQLPHLAAYPIHGSRVRCGRDGLADYRSDPRHIEYDYASQGSLSTRVSYLQLLQKELQLQNIEPVGRQIAELQVQLHELLLMEKRYELLHEVVEEASLDRAMIKLEKAIPDLLHLENRGGEAVITHLFINGLRLVEGSEEVTKALMDAIQMVINQRLFGDPGSPSNWKFPINKDGTMGDISFANWRARRIIDNIDHLIQQCFPGDERAAVRAQWNAAIEACARQ